MLSGWAIFGWIVFAFAFLILIWFFALYNTLTKCRRYAKEDFEKIESLNSERNNLIFGLEKTIKDCEKENIAELDELIKVYGAVFESEDRCEIMKRVNAITNAINNLFNATALNVNLQTNVEFLKLQNIFKNYENDIELVRESYNAIA